MSIEWITIPKDKNPRDLLPKDKPFLALWKGAICLCEFDEEINRFYIGMMPASYLGFWKLDIDREKKFTHYANVELPKDY